MTCEELRAALLELPPDAIASQPHLAECARCRELADALQTRHADLERALSSGGDPPTSLVVPRPANTPWRWSMSSIALVTAVAATLAVGARTLWTPPPSAPAAPGCGEPAALEALAVEGGLSPAQIACLEASAARGGMGAPYRLLAVHHYTVGDLDAWESAVEREIARQDAAGERDPDIRLKLALHRSKVGRHAEVPAVATAALAQAGVWDEPVRAQRVGTLHRVRTAALHHQLEAARSDGAAVDAFERAVREAARAWIAHQRAHDLPTETPETLCADANGGLGCEP